MRRTQSRFVERAGIILLCVSGVLANLAEPVWAESGPLLGGQTSLRSKPLVVTRSASIPQVGNGGAGSEWAIQGSSLIVIMDAFLARAEFDSSHYSTGCLLGAKECSKNYGESGRLNDGPRRVAVMRIGPDNTQSWLSASMRFEPTLATSDENIPRLLLQRAWPSPPTSTFFAVPAYAIPDPATSLQLDTQLENKRILVISENGGRLFELPTTGADQQYFGGFSPNGVVVSRNVRGVSSGLVEAYKPDVSFLSEWNVSSGTAAPLSTPTSCTNQADHESYVVRTPDSRIVTRISCNDTKGLAVLGADGSRLLTLTTATDVVMSGDGTVWIVEQPTASVAYAKFTALLPSGGTRIILSRDRGVVQVIPSGGDRIWYKAYPSKTKASIFQVDANGRVMKSLSASVSSIQSLLAGDGSGFWFTRPGPQTKVFYASA